MNTDNETEEKIMLVHKEAEIMLVRKTITITITITYYYYYY